MGPSQTVQAAKRGFAMFYLSVHKAILMMSLSAPTAAFRLPSSPHPFVSVRSPQPSIRIRLGQPIMKATDVSGPTRKFRKEYTVVLPSKRKTPQPRPSPPNPYESEYWYD